MSLEPTRAAETLVDMGLFKNPVDSGGMSERFKVTVLKTVVRQRTVGSNPTPSEKAT